MIEITEIGTPELERWRRDFLDGGQQGLKKNRPGGELMRTRVKLGEMTMRVQLQAELMVWKRGPKTALSDEELLQEIRSTPAYVGEPE